MAVSCDYFDSRTAQNFLTGGDGPKAWNWSARNTVRAATFNANTANADKLTIALSADNNAIAFPDSPMAYQQVSGDFDCEIFWSDNRANIYESVGLFIMSSARWDSYVYITNFYGGIGTSANDIAGRSKVNGGVEAAVGADVPNTAARRLRLARKGDVFSAYWKINAGDNWTLLGSVTRTDLSGAAVYVGVYAQAYNVAGTFVAQIEQFLFNSFATEETLLSDSFAGNNGDPISPATWAVQSGAITIQANKGQVAAGADTVFVSVSRISYEDGLSIEADFGSSAASDPVPYFQLGFQDEAYVGQMKSIIKVVYQNGMVYLYCVNAAGVTQPAQSYTLALAKTLPKKIALRFVSPTSVRAYADGVDLGAKTINIPALPDNLRAWFELYNAGNTATITVDNVAVRRNTPCAWPKYGRNPIYTGNDQAWENGNVEDGSTVKRGTTFYRFYCAGTTSIKVGCMSCSEMDFPYGPWTKYIGNPIVSPVAPQITVAAPKVIQMQDGSWRMYTHNYDGTHDRMYFYTTTDAAFPAGWAIANSGNPVFSEDPGQWDGAQIQSHAIIPPWVSGDVVWHLYYGGQNSAARPGGVWQMGHATSPDGIVWTRDPANPVLSPVTGNWWEAYEVVPLGYIKAAHGVFHIVYQAYSGSCWRIGHATVTAANWSLLARSGDNPVIIESVPGNWDSSGPEGCDLYYDPDTLGVAHAFFLGSSVPNAMQGGSNYSAGVVTTTFPVDIPGFAVLSRLRRARREA